MFVYSKSMVCFWPVVAQLSLQQSVVPLPKEEIAIEIEQDEIITPGPKTEPDFQDKKVCFLNWIN